MEDNDKKMMKIQQWVTILKNQENLNGKESVMYASALAVFETVRRSAAKLQVLSIAHVVTTSAVELTKLIQSIVEGPAACKLAALANASDEIQRMWKLMGKMHRRALKKLHDPTGSLLGFAYVSEKEFQRAWRSWRWTALEVLYQSALLVREWAQHKDSQPKAFKAFILHTKLLNFLLTNAELASFMYGLASSLVPVSLGELCILVGEDMGSTILKDGKKPGLESMRMLSDISFPATPSQPLSLKPSLKLFSPIMEETTVIANQLKQDIMGTGELITRILPMGVMFGNSINRAASRLNDMSRPNGPPDCQSFEFAHLLPAAPVVWSQLDQVMSNQLQKQRRKEADSFSEAEIVDAAFLGPWAHLDGALARVALHFFIVSQRLAFRNTYMDTKDKGFTLSEEPYIERRTDITPVTPIAEAHPGTTTHRRHSGNWSVSTGFQSFGEFKEMPETPFCLTSGACFISHLLTAMESKLRKDKVAASLAGVEEEEDSKINMLSLIKLSCAESLGLQLVRWQDECISYVTHKLQATSDVGFSIDCMKKLLALAIDLQSIAQEFERIRALHTDLCWARDSLSGIAGVIHQLENACASLLQVVEDITSQVVVTLCENHIAMNTFNPKGSNVVAEKSPRQNKNHKENCDANGTEEQKSTRRKVAGDCTPNSEILEVTNLSEYMKEIINKVLYPSAIMMKKCDRETFFIPAFSKLVNVCCCSLDSFFIRSKDHLRISIQGADILHRDIHGLIDWVEAVSSCAILYCWGIGRFRHILRILKAALPFASWDAEELKSYRALPDARDWMSLRLDMGKRAKPLPKKVPPKPVKRPSIY